MALGKEHPLHGRRKRSNLLLGAVLGGFVALVFAITIVKMAGGGSMEGYDHTIRYSIDPELKATEADQ
ncbi:hypothetical protein [Neptunicoccus sediminis]|uniref:hypothetical protein n=1 Tax=Neptunicoccus sediminis TaxID=1892596 RepID=UPI000845E2E5|nr:hypothetical protein [Neptunicoccus sediminis]